MTPLYSAATLGKENCVRMLLAHDGIDANIPNESGRTPLYSAAREGHLGCVEMLLVGHAGQFPPSALWAASSQLYSTHARQYIEKYSGVRFCVGGATLPTTATLSFSTIILASVSGLFTTHTAALSTPGMHLQRGATECWGAQSEAVLHCDIIVASQCGIVAALL
jgi:hypothetical protein